MTRWMTALSPAHQQAILIPILGLQLPLLKAVSLDPAVLELAEIIRAKGIGLLLGGHSGLEISPVYSTENQGCVQSGAEAKRVFEGRLAISEAGLVLLSHPWDF